MAKLTSKIHEVRHIEYVLGAHETIPQALVIIGGWFKNEPVPDRLESVVIHIEKPRGTIASPQ